MKKITIIKSVALFFAAGLILSVSSFGNSVKTKREVKIGLYEKATCTYFNPSNGQTSNGNKCISGNTGNCVSPAVCYPVK